MIRAIPRIQRLAAALAVIFIALAATSPNGTYAQNQAAPERAKTELEKLFESGEKKFRDEGKFAEAVKDYQDLLKKYAVSMAPEQQAVLHWRIASCYFLLRNWSEAEKELKIFLDATKFPNGTGDFLDPRNNFRGTAEIMLADVYAISEKWDDAIGILQKLRNSTNLRLEDRTKATIQLTKMLDGKVRDKNAEAKKNAALQSIELLKLVVSKKNYIVPEVKEAANRLIELYTRVGAIREAQLLQDEISARISGSPFDMVKASFQRIEIGDALFEQGEMESDAIRKEQLYRQALSSFQDTLRRIGIEVLIERAIKEKDAEVESITRRYPNPSDEQKEQIKKINAEKEDFAKMVEQFKQNKDYDAFISYRIGLCLLELHRPWEAYIAFKDIFDHNPSYSRASTASFYYIRALRGIHRNKEAQTLCREFLQKYPNAEEVGEIAIQLGEISFEEEDYTEAVKQFKWARENVKTLSDLHKEWIDWYIAVCEFSNVEWENARGAIDDFVAKHPQSKQMEEMTYMRGLCYFFVGDYKGTMSSFTDYLEKYPDGQFKPDARYRLAVVKFGLKPKDSEEEKNNVNDVIKRCHSWITDYENPPASLAGAIAKQRPEIYTLLADCYIRFFDSKDKKITAEERAENLQKAIENFILAAKNSRHNTQTLDYSTKELNKRLPAQGDWAKLLDVYVTLYNWDRDDPKALLYLYWIIRSSEKLGKTEVEKRTSLAKAHVEVPEEFVLKTAEEILADAIILNINDPAKENVEQLISELAGKLAKQARANIRAGGEATNTEAEIFKLLKLDQGQPTLIAQARGYFTRAEMARLLKDTARQNENLQRIATIFKPEELSPTILGTTGDMLLAKKEYTKALEFYQYILDHFRSSDFADYGFAGKGEILIHQEKYAEALKLLNEAIENDVTFSKEKEIRLAQAQALIGVGGEENYTAAEKILNSIATNREWRGEPTATALYLLGKIEEKRGRVNEAINLYRRCYLAWKKHGNITGKAYLRTAELFDQKGDAAGYKGTLLEMLHPDNPASKSPEAARAAELLNKLQ